MAQASDYQALSDVEHALVASSMYIGSVDTTETDMFIFEEESSNIKESKIEYNAGLVRIFEEILLNAFDHTVRDDTCNEVRVCVDIESNSITVMNNGNGIPIIKKEELDIYIPEMLFGMMRSGSNFNKDKKRIVGGQHGLGGSLANIFSKKFILTTIDSNVKKMYTQVWTDNMSVKSKPDIKNSKKKPFTMVSFEPDLARFGMDCLSKDFELLLKKRVIDISFSSSKKIRTYFNNEEMTVKKPDDYIMLYQHLNGDKPIVDIMDRWVVGVCFSSNGFQHVSFVNGIHTIVGGTHVDYVVNIITKEIITKLASKKIIIKPADVKNKMFLFVNSVIECPKFSGQVKEKLNTPSAKFGSKYEMSDAFKKKLLKSNLYEAMAAVSDSKQMKELTKTNGTKASRLGEVEDLEDANWAARKRNLETRLILCEGKSAKTFAMGALKVLGRDRFGIFPLRGKLLNVRDAQLAKVAANNEIKNIMKIIGLKYGTTYESETDFKSLRYGGVISLTDSDVDGYHISGLIINYFHNFWPILVERGFIKFCITPIVKVYHGKSINTFYTLSDYEEWLKTASGKFRTKYFKGLGTSTRDEACEALGDIDNKLITFHRDEECDETVSLAFNPKRADDRKEWLLNRYDPTSSIDRTIQDCDVSDFINHELIHFSTYDCERSIPNVMDGLKISQRKIMFISMKYIAKDEMKVGQLAPKVAEQTDYHHGETSLCGAVVGMAQDYVGSNNINLLEPHGGFGSRLSGGKDAASPRYIFTQLNPLAIKLFDVRDNCLLIDNESDGIKIEPKYYAPVLPMILINGTLGIGTGFSTSVLKYNPKDIGLYIKAILEDTKKRTLVPWYRGFKGTIIKDKKCKYITYAVWEFIDKDHSLLITDLPINIWTDDYKTFCEKLLAEKESPLQDVVYAYDDINIDIRLVFKKSHYDTYKNMDKDELVKTFKLSSKLSETNMYLFNVEGKLQYFETVYEIISYYYMIRLRMYEDRRNAMIEQLLYEMLILSNKAKFIKYVKQGKISPQKMTDESLLDELNKSFDKDPRAQGSNQFAPYDYLVSMNYRSFTNENAKRMEDLVKAKQEEIDALKKTTAKQMWIDDINAILELLDKSGDISKKPTKTRVAAKTTKRVVKSKK